GTSRATPRGVRVASSRTPPKGLAFNSSERVLGQRVAPTSPSSGLPQRTWLYDFCWRVMRLAEYCGPAEATGRSYQEMSSPKDLFRGSGAGRLPRFRTITVVCLTLAAVGLIWAATASQAAGACPIPGNFEIDGDMIQNTCTPGANDWNTPNIGV